MAGRWNTRPGPGRSVEPVVSPRNPASLEPGPNLSRRRFVELAVGAAAGVTLVGAGAPAVGARPKDGMAVRACDGQMAPERMRGDAVTVEEPNDIEHLRDRFPTT